MTYAIIRTGDKQFRAEPGKVLQIPLLDAEVGSKVTFDEVLLASGDDGVQVGAPTVEKAKVTAEVLEHGTGPKITIFKWKRRKNYRKKQGHRQGYTAVRIADIKVG